MLVICWHHLSQSCRPFSLLASCNLMPGILLSTDVSSLGACEYMTVPRPPCWAVPASYVVHAVPQMQVHA